MTTAITFHAIQRLQERRKCTHLLRHIHKMSKWRMPDDGIFEHKGNRYVLRGGGCHNCIATDKKVHETIKEGGRA